MNVKLAVELGSGGRIQAGAHIDSAEGEPCGTSLRPQNEPITAGGHVLQRGKGAQPQVSGSGARLKKLSIKLATPNSPSTVYCSTVIGIRSSSI